MNQLLDSQLNIIKAPRGRASSVHFGQTYRFNKAVEESTKEPVSVEEISGLITSFLNEINIGTTDQPRYENPLPFDYQGIKTEFKLNDERDIVWIKFTKDGYIGVVATSNDINFNYPTCESDYDKKDEDEDDNWIFNTSGILVHELKKNWDESFVLVFPLANIPDGYIRGDIEEAVGNLLINNKVPILDYYSHIY